MAHPALKNEIDDGTERADQKRSRAAAWWIALVAPVVVALVVSFAPVHELGPLATVSGGILLLLLVTAAVTDVRAHCIYNWTTYPAILWAVGLNAYVSVRFPDQILPAATTVQSRVNFDRDSGIVEKLDEFDRLGAVGISRCLYGAGACFLLMLFVYSFSGRGAGDVKLATAIGALIGLRQGLAALCMTYLFAGLAILAWIIWQQGPVFVVKRTVRSAFGFFHPKFASPPDESRDLSAMLSRPIPLGLFHAIGTLVVVLNVIEV